MRIHKLTLAGFGPYRDEYSIDFDEFAGDIFLIDGNTGAGKSTILDAIVYALYNTVPRYDVSAATKIRSDFCDETNKTFVTLEFTINGERYRVSRNPDYRGPGGARGNAVNVQTNAVLEHFVGGDWMGIAEKPREVGLALTPILVLTVDQFLQVIMLAQNKFMDFLNASSEQRATILSAIFRTSRFADVQEEFKGRADALDAQLADAKRDREAFADKARETVRDVMRDDEGAPDTALVDSGIVLDEPSPDAAWFAALIELIAVAQSSAQDALTQATTRRAGTREARDALFKAQERFTNFAGARRTLEQAPEKQPLIDEQRARVAVAERAQQVRPHIAQAESRFEALSAAGEELVAAHERAVSCGASNDVRDVSSVTADAVTTRSDDIKAILQKLDAARDKDEQVIAKKRELTDKETECLASREKNDTLAVREGELPELIQTANEEVIRLSALAETVAEREKTVADAVKLRDAVDALSTAVAALAAAEKKTLKAGTDATNAAGAVDQLMNQRVNGMAFVIAADLADGEPCAVCGSTSHPAPATTELHIPDDDEIARAQQKRDELEAARKAAEDREGKLRTEKATAEAVAGAVSADEARAKLSQAEAALTEATKAVGDLATSKEARDLLDAEKTDIARQRKELAADIARLDAEIKTISAAVTDMEKELVALRGDFATLAEREVFEKSRVDALATLLEAINALASATTENNNAQKALLDSVTKNGFDSVDTARYALLDPDDIARLANEVTTFDAELKAARELLEGAGADANTLVDVSADLAVADEKLRTDDDLVSRAQTRLQALGDATIRLSDIARDVDAHDKGNEVLFARQRMMRGLADAMAGKEPNTHRMRLETFVLAARLEDITRKANLRLAKMSGGQYELKHDDSLQGNRLVGLGIKVLDNWTGQLRESRSLSGGESFLASMALAFGLAEVVSESAGGIQLDTLFMDEGFAALDGEILQTAMNTLQELRDTGRTIGLISHVGPMKEQIANKIHVAKGNDGTSVITVHRD